MKKETYRFVGVFIIFIVMFSGTASFAKKQRIIFGGGPPGGSFDIFAHSLQIYPSIKALENIAIEAKSTSGSIENLRRTNANKQQMSIVMASHLWLGKNGWLNNDPKIYDQVKIVAKLYDVPIQIVVRKDAGINSVYELRGRRVGVGLPGSGAFSLCELFFSHLGIWNQIERNRMGYNDAATALNNGDLDAFWLNTAIPSSAVIMGAGTNNIDLLDVEQAAKQSGFFEKYPVFSKFVIPAGTYTGVDREVSTFQDSVVWVANNDVSSDVIYRILSAVGKENRKAVLAHMVSTKSARYRYTDLNPNKTGLSVLTHAGAKQYWLDEDPPQVTKKKSYCIVDVFFGTDRKQEAGTHPSVRYGPDKGNGFKYGIAEVSIPKDHKLGELDSPKWWKLEFTTDPEKHVSLLKVKTESQFAFFKILKNEMLKQNNNATFIFIHGFNVSFEDSIRRTAQIAHDLQYPGIPVAYSWPSRGSPDPGSYMADSESSEWSFPHLKKFLVDIKTRTKTKKIHLLAHSMGNRVMTKAIQALETNELKLNQVILAAPDISTRIFRDQIAPKLAKKAMRYTLYASSKDAALILSAKFQKGQRLGQSGNNLFVLKGIDTIEASNIDTSMLGHSYYGDERELIFDMYHLIENNVSPDHRNLVRESKDGLAFWRLRQ